MGEGRATFPPVWGEGNNLHLPVAPSFDMSGRPKRKAAVLCLQRFAAPPDGGDGVEDDDDDFAVAPPLVVKKPAAKAKTSSKVRALHTAPTAVMRTTTRLQPPGLSGPVSNNGLVNLLFDASGTRKPDSKLPSRKVPAPPSAGRLPFTVVGGPFDGVTLRPSGARAWKLVATSAAHLGWNPSTTTPRWLSGEAHKPKNRVKEEDQYRTSFPFSPPRGPAQKSKVTGEKLVWGWQTGEWLEPMEAEKQRVDRVERATPLASAEPGQSAGVKCAAAGCIARVGLEWQGRTLTELDFDLDHDGTTVTSVLARDKIAARREDLASGHSRFLCISCHRRASLSQLHFDVPPAL